MPPLHRENAMTFDSLASPARPKSDESPSEVSSRRQAMARYRKDWSSGTVARVMADVVRGFRRLRVRDPVEEVQKMRQKREAEALADFRLKQASLKPPAPCSCCINLIDHQRKHSPYRGMGFSSWTLYGFIAMAIWIFAGRFVIGSVVWIVGWATGTLGLHSEDIRYDMGRAGELDLLTISD